MPSDASPVQRLCPSWNRSPSKNFWESGSTKRTASIQSNPNGAVSAEPKAWAAAGAEMAYQSPESPKCSDRFGSDPEATMSSTSAAYRAESLAPAWPLRMTYSRASGAGPVSP